MSHERTTSPIRSGNEPSSSVAAGPEFTGLDRQSALVFVGLMMGMFVASISQTIVGPALPRIVAELGGMEHYSWIATAAMLAAAVTVPIVGKLSDMYGRKRFYIAGLLIFMVGSALSGLATNFWFLVMARALQGAGMGTVMPLSQTIIGDIIPPRYRGKYQGYMGAVFGLSSVAGPLLGGWVTDAWGWRYLFYLALPIGVLALAFLLRYMHVPHTPRPGTLDVAGILTLTPALVSGLLALSWGGKDYAWTSPLILGILGASLALVVGFVQIERRAPNPLIRLGMLRDRTVSLSILASFFIAVAMFGAIIYIPVFAQGALGVSATESGAVLIPLNLAMILTSIGAGLVITRTGRYKEILVLGAAIMLAGYILLTQLDWQSSTLFLGGVMLVIGVGLGMSLQTYTLVVQNAVAQSELGVATSAVQFFRNIGSTVGIAVLGSIMSAQMMPKIAARLPEGARATMGPMSGGEEASAVLDPSQLSHLPPQVIEAIRAGMGDAMHTVFLTAVPFVVAALALSLFVQQRTLRTTN